MTFELGRGLLLSGAVSAEKLAESLYVVASQGIPLARALVGLGMLDEARLEEELARVSPAALTHVEPLRQLMARLPLGLCHRLAVAPISVDTVKGVVDVAMLDLRDAHVTDEVAYHLKMPVRGRRATYGALREALERYPVGLRAIAAPSGGALDSRAPPRITQRLPAFPDGARLVHRKGAGAPPADSEPQSIKTRIWDSSDTSLGLGDEASWDSEPVFELRRLGPPATVQDPEPETTRAPHEENVALPLRVPIASRAPSLPYPDLGSTLAGIRAATDRDGVLGLVQVGARTAARRVALLVVRKDGLGGWSCTPEFGDEGALKQVKIPLAPPHSLTPILSGTVHLGPLPETLAAPLLRVMGEASHEVAIAAIRVADRAAVLIVADDLGDTTLATKRLEDLARVGGDSLLRILRAPRA